MKQTLIDRIRRRDLTAGVIGLGYVGLPLAVELARAGFRVIGIDRKPEVVARLNRGESHILDVPSSALAPLVADGRFVATTDPARLGEIDTVSICVPTPLTKTKDPDVSYIREAIDGLLPHLRPGMLVVLESTTYPGTTNELVAHRIERERGLAVGEQIFVAFSPERVDPGNPLYGTHNTPKVLGGVTAACTEVASALYGLVVERVHPVGSATEAEMVKLLENTFRAVNIALVNEMLLMCHRLSIDIWNVIAAAATKPFGFMPFYPGPGIGGHCIPLDPSYLSWKARSVDFYNRFIELATDINGNMPRFVLQRAQDLLNDEGRALKGSRLLVLGMAYKPNIDDLRESPGLELYRLLRQKGAWVEFHDPLAGSFVSVLGKTVVSSPIDGDRLAGFDLVILVTDHDAFDYPRIAAEARRVLDCRNGFGKRGVHAANVVKL